MRLERTDGEIGAREAAAGALERRAAAGGFATILARARGEPRGAGPAAVGLPARRAAGRRAGRGARGADPEGRPGLPPGLAAGAPPLRARAGGEALRACPGAAVRDAGALGLLVERLGGGGAALELRFGDELAVRLVHTPRGVELALRPGLGPRTPGRGALPALVRALRARGVRVAAAPAEPRRSRVDAATALR